MLKLRFCPKLAADWLRALERKPNHALSLLALAEYELEWFDLTAAEHYATRALAALTLYNAHPQSGMVYYLLGRIFEEQKTLKPLTTTIIKPTGRPIAWPRP